MPTHKSRRIDWPALLLVLFVTVMLMVLSMMRYTGYNAGMLDIGDMAQAMWSGTQGNPLEYSEPLHDTFDQLSISRLAVHVEIIYFLLVPVYALLPDPRILLVIQALWFGAGAWPVYRLALRHLEERRYALALMVAYLFYPVAQTAVLFDFHGDTLAMPALLFALEALDRRAWRTYGIWILIALTCKFYVSVPVAMLGLVLWWRGERRAGVWTFLAGIAWLALTLGVIRPSFAPPLESASDSSLLRYVQFYFGGMETALIRTGIQRVLTAVVVFLPGLWLGRYAWHWCLPAFGIALPALASNSHQASYDFRFHHYAVAVPFLVVATIYGTIRLRKTQERAQPEGKQGRRPWQGGLFLAVGVTLIFNLCLVDTPLNPQFWMNKPNWGTNQWKYGQTPRDRFKDGWLAEHVPDQVPLLASEYLAPHVTKRQILGLVRYPSADAIQRALREGQYAVADALNDFSFSITQDAFIGGALQDVAGIEAILNDPQFKLLDAQDGLLLFGRDPAPGQAQIQEYQVHQRNAEEVPLHDFGEAVGLLSAKVEPLGRRRFRLRYEWVALKPLDGRVALFAVTRLDGVAHSRMVHLPTQALYPTTSWLTGEVVEETFEVELPPDLSPGTYRLLTGWYDGGNIHAAATDERSRLGAELLTGTITIE